MNNLNEKCVLLYGELLARKGLKRTKLLKAQLSEGPYLQTCDSYYVGGKKTNEQIVKGAILMDGHDGKDSVCLLVNDLDTDKLCIKVFDVKLGMAIGLDHMIKISYGNNGEIQHDFMQRKEAVYKGSLSAFISPPSLQSVVKYVTAPNLY